VKVLVTGTLGFIFSNFIRRVVELPGYRWVGVDKAVRPHALLNTFEHPDYKFYLADIADAHAMASIFQIEKPDVVIGGAAESFVDDSITDVMPFLHSNVVGTQTLVNACLRHGARYLHISTDEVYGQQLTKDAIGWVENVPMAPRNPYAASKACAELVVLAAHETHGLQYQITRSCNVFGPRQKKENLVPHIITSLRAGHPVHVHGTGLNFRQYVYVDDAVDAIMCVLERGESGRVYNVGDDHLLTNLQMVSRVAEMLGVSASIEYIADRKGHDFGYKVSSNRLRELGWEPRASFNDGMARTLEFYRGL
jgi:dTDP-glucose 4,6-dehydratase